MVRLGMHFITYWFHTARQSQKKIVTMLADCRRTFHISITIFLNWHSAFCHEFDKLPLWAHHKEKECNFACTFKGRGYKNLPSQSSRSFPSIALRIPTAHNFALENGGFFFTAGPRHRGKSSFLRKRVRWPIIFFRCFESSIEFLYLK